LNDEVRSHLEMAAQDRAERGAKPANAESTARREFGNVELVKETTREMWGWGWLDRLKQDLRFGMRILTKSPGFAAVAIVTLALGIGVNTALFSVVNGVLLNPLRFPKPEELVTLHESKPNFDEGSISYPNFRDWRKNNQTFAMMGIERGNSYSLTGAGEAEQVQAELVSSELLPLLGVRPVMGRMFSEGEDEIGAAPVVLISEGFWKRKFGAAKDILSKSLTLDGRSYPIVGVLPASFNLDVGGFSASDVYVPICQWSNPLLPMRDAGLGIHGIGRLKGGVTVQQARTDMQRVTRDLAAAYPEANKGIGATLIPLKERMVRGVRSQLLALLAAVGFVLLIACVNVANLLLARSLGRTREFALRAALGAGRGRILRQLLTESVLLSLAGGGLGLLLAAWGTKAALAHLPQGMPRANEVGMDTRVLLFTLGISLLCGILFGLAPALKISKADLQNTLKEGGRGSGGAKHRSQGVLVVAEMAMALVLLVAAGLMVRSLTAVWNVNPGFDAHNVLSFGLSLSPSMKTASPEAIRAALREMQRKLAALPSTKSISLSWGATTLGWDDEDLFWMEGQPKPDSDSEMNWALSYVVQEDYLRVMGISLEHGRFFTPRDNENAPHVVVVDDVFAQKFFPNQDPIGKRIVMANKGGTAEIVGIVGHVKQWGLDSDEQNALRAELYFPYMQLPDQAMRLSANGTGVVVKFEGSATATAAAVRTAVRQINGEAIVYGAQTMEQLIANSLADRQVSMIVFGVFAALALGLASVGIYGVISYLAGRRTQEIGVRMALGAKRVDVLKMVLGEGLKLAVLGVGLGVIAALGLMRLLQNLLFGVSASDPETFAIVGILLTCVAAAACYVPAHRATKVDPIVALRYE